jgi:hypothetical protein
MRNTADVKSGKPIDVLLQYISGVSAINPLAVFYDIHGDSVYSVLNWKKSIGQKFINR